MPAIGWTRPDPIGMNYSVRPALLGARLAGEDLVKTFMGGDGALPLRAASVVAP